MNEADIRQLLNDVQGSIGDSLMVNRENIMLKKEIIELKDKMHFFRDQNDKLQSDIQSLTSKIYMKDVQIQCLENENKDLKNQISQLQKSINILEHTSQKSTAEQSEHSEADNDKKNSNSINKHSIQSNDEEIQEINDHDEVKIIPKLAPVSQIIHEIQVLKIESIEDYAQSLLFVSNSLKEVKREYVSLVNLLIRSLSDKDTIEPHYKNYVVFLFHFLPLLSPNLLNQVLDNFKGNELIKSEFNSLIDEHFSLELEASECENEEEEEEDDIL